MTGWRRGPEGTGSPRSLIWLVGSNCGLMRSRALLLSLRLRRLVGGFVFFSLEAEEITGGVDHTEAATIGRRALQAHRRLVQELVHHRPRELLHGVTIGRRQVRELLHGL